MATASPGDDGGVDAAGGGVDGPGGEGLLGGGEANQVEEVCGSSNPSQAPQRRAPSPSLEYRAADALARAVQATLTGSHQWVSGFGGVDLCDDVWEVRLHFHDKDNLERSMCVSDITFLNLIALIETAGYGEGDYMYYVKNGGLGVAGLEEICDDDKIDEMLDHIASKDQTIVNLTVVRGNEPRPGDLNIGHVYEQQVPICNVGERTVYEVSDQGVLYRSPSKKARRVAQVDEKGVDPIQFYSTQQITHLFMQEARDVHMDDGNAGDVDLEQEELERTMELKRKNKIQRFKKHKKSVERVEAIKRKLPVLLTEDDSDLELDEDFMARMAEMRRQREDPLLHFEGDTDVEELYEVE